MGITKNDQPSLFRSAMLPALSVAVIGCVFIYFATITDKPGLMVFNFLIVSVVLFIFGKNFRKKQKGGYIAFGRVFSLCFISMVIAGVLCSLFSYSFHIIAPGKTEQIVQNELKNAEKQMIDSGMTQDQVDAQIEIQRFMFKARVIGPVLLFTAVGAMLSLIMAAILKIEPPKNY